MIDLGVWVDRTQAHTMIAQGMSAPAPQTVRALIDTGSDISAAHPLIQTQLGVPSTGAVRVRRPGLGQAAHNAPLYDTRLAFGGVQAGVAWIPLPVVGVVPSTPGILAIIGRDMLRNCFFLYDGFRSEFLLMY